MEQAGAAAVAADAAAAAAAAAASVTVETTASAAAASRRGTGGGERGGGGGETARSTSQRECLVGMFPLTENYAFRPCGHAGTCGHCTDRILGGESGSPPRCPVCRAEVSGRMRVYA